MFQYVLFKLFVSLKLLNPGIEATKTTFKLGVIE